MGRKILVDGWMWNSEFVSFSSLEPVEKGARECKRRKGWVPIACQVPVSTYKKLNPSERVLSVRLEKGEEPAKIDIMPSRLVHGGYMYFVRKYALKGGKDE